MRWGNIKGMPMSCDLVEIRLNNGLVISLYNNDHGGWFRDKVVTERQMWERMARAIGSTDFEAVKALYGQMEGPSEEENK